ncbi:hypothetical protein I551_0228 [Mycobacterium ulcerans str. Harvey]|uniref:Uncharacterized protein n=1 Tax=Mycobacterium ulcerans str. Harvey TaxID=1299332 RepID=A0ABN0R846_MYCUL|nr:hypothetical protein I551_0228 [Mycobacterium ulcerans str. Harvey]
MRDVLTDLITIWRAGDTAGLATVVRTLRSAPGLRARRWWWRRMVR